MAKSSGKSKKKTTIPLKKPQVDFIIQEFLDRKDYRMVIVCIFLFKCIRVNDVLNSLKISDVYKKGGASKGILAYTESKTKKEREVSLKGDILQDSLKQHFQIIKHLEIGAGLFQTKKTGRDLQASGVRSLLRSFEGKREISQCSCHSFRKAGSRFMYDNNVRIEEISNVLNHHSTAVTERYIALTKEKIRESMKCLDI